MVKFRIFEKYFSNENLKKGAQKVLEFCSNVLKESNNNPKIGILNATKNVAKSEMKKSINNLFGNKKGINKPSSTNPISVSRK